MPTPSKILHARSCCQLWQKALPITGHRQKLAAKKMLPRRPMTLLMGSDIQQPKIAVPMYGPEFTKPIMTLSRIWWPSMPKAFGKKRFAPFEPV